MTAFAAGRVRAVADDAPLPDGGGASSRWRASRRSATRCWRATRRSACGCKSDESPKQLGEDVHRLSLVVLEFPKFRDGRAFSWARMLRTRLGFTGEIRAVGDFLYDQIAYQHRVGFDAWEVPDDFTLEHVPPRAARDDQRLSAQRRRPENHPRAAGAKVTPSQ